VIILYPTVTFEGVFVALVQIQVTTGVLGDFFIIHALGCESHASEVQWWLKPHSYAWGMPKTVKLDEMCGSICPIFL